jgi:hypothetical protein
MFQGIATNSPSTSPQSGLALMGDDGQWRTSFVSGMTNSWVFSLTQMTNGNILVAGSLFPTNANRHELVAQMTPLLQWSSDFDADGFGSLGGEHARAVLVQPDGKLVVAGHFFEAGGYWRRHIVRLGADGRVDPCFDPGLGLGGFSSARSLARQNDGMVLVGGLFDSREWVGVANLARLLPQGECGGMRSYLIRGGGGTFAIGTCPPGGTNLLQSSTNLIHWETLDRQTGPYLFQVVEPTRPNMFFRMKKEF